MAGTNTKGFVAKRNTKYVTRIKRFKHNAHLLAAEP
jgi:hypothetical protein